MEHAQYKFQIIIIIIFVVPGTMIVINDFEVSIKVFTNIIFNTSGAS